MFLVLHSRALALGVFLGGIAGRVFGRFLFPRASPLPGRLPYSLADVYDLRRKPVPSDVAADLWQIPISAREVLEALYLEHREVLLVKREPAALPLAVLSAIIYLVAMQPALLEAWRHILPLALFGLLGFQIRRKLRYEDGADAAYRHVGYIVMAWEREMAVSDTMFHRSNEELSQTYKLAALLVLPSLAALGCIVWLVAGITKGIRLDDLAHILVISSILAWFNIVAGTDSLRARERIRERDWNCLVERGAACFEFAARRQLCPP